MAEEAPAKPAPKAKKGSALSGSWHGIPKPVLAIGAGGGAFLLYRWWKNRSASSATSTTPASTANPAATGTDSGLGGGFAGTGAGGGGSFGGTPAATGNRRNRQNTATATTPAAATATTAEQAAITAAPAQQASLPPPLLPTQQNLQSVATPVATPTSGTGAGGNPNGTPGTFDLKSGTVNFQPTAAVVNGNQVAYGIPNQGTASTIEKAGGTVESGKALMAKGWSNLTPGALYLLR